MGASHAYCPSGTGGRNKPILERKRKARTRQGAQAVPAGSYIYPCLCYFFFLGAALAAFFAPLTILLSTLDVENFTAVRAGILISAPV